MEEFAKRVRNLLKMLCGVITPHFRQFLRFLGLPYCYFFLVNWSECTRSRWQVIWDLLYIFFVLRNFPDHYSKCRLYELERKDWIFYYGSNYNPYQRGKLNRFVQPSEYEVVFENKEICQKLCEGLGIVVPSSVGVLDPLLGLEAQLRQLLPRSSAEEFFLKPVTGSAGQAIIHARKVGSDFILSDQRGQLKEGSLPRLERRFLIQEKVIQHDEFEAINSSSVNTIRILTLYTSRAESLVLATAVRFGVEGAHIDNWSAGGIVFGIDRVTGVLADLGFDKKGNGYTHHPDSQFPLAGFQVPMWDSAMEFARFVQGRFPYYRLLGLDVAITNGGPVLIEINAFPDFVFMEQATGPFLRDPLIYEEFGAYDLFYNRYQKRIGVGFGKAPRN